MEYFCMMLGWHFLRQGFDLKSAFWSPLLATTPSSSLPRLLSFMIIIISQSLLSFLTFFFSLSSHYDICMRDFMIRNFSNNVDMKLSYCLELGVSFKEDLYNLK